MTRVECAASPVMPEEAAATIRRRAWTKAMRDRYKITEFGMHDCGCQPFPTGPVADRCSHCEAGRHGKCVYNRHHPPSHETLLRWPDDTPVWDRTATSSERRVMRVYLADRDCRSWCRCECEGRTPHEGRHMSWQQAEWVREHAWLPVMRKGYRDVPAFTHRCRCQWGLTGHCGAGNHAECTAGEPVPGCETWVSNRQGQVIDPKGGAVWLADRTCRYRCPCTCHEPAKTDDLTWWAQLPEGRSAPPEGQMTLFGAVA